MYQESDDKIRGTSRSDTLLFILLILAFFAIGAVATALKAHFDNNLPIYVFAILGAICVYIVYRIRILGFRYTVFYKEPEPEYDARFDDYMMHEDYPYPVGTFVAERTSSAKGTIIAVIDKANMIALLAPGEEYSGPVEEIVCCSHSKAKSHSLIYKDEGRTVRMYIAPSEELIGYINGLLNDGAEADID